MLRIKEFELDTSEIVAGLFSIDVPFALRWKGEHYAMLSVAHIAAHCYRSVDEEHINSVISQKDDYEKELRKCIIYRVEL